MKRILLIALLIQLGYAGFTQDATTAPADTSYWKKGGLASVTFTQVSLSNWAAGGDNSVSLSGFFSAFADYKRDKVTWRNSVEMGYGLIRQGEGEFEKTDDRLNFITEFNYRIKGKKLFWSSVLDFRTQFDRGLDSEGNTISRLFSPAYVVLATGLQWNPNPAFSFSYSPVGGKFTFVLDQDLANAGAFGVDEGFFDEDLGRYTTLGSTSRAELGSFVKLSYNKEVVENVRFETRLELFANYLQDFGNIDVNWQNLLVMKVNNFLTVNWQTQLIYDDDIKIDEFNAAGELISRGPRTQFKSVFGVGLAYNFGVSR